MLDLKSNIKEIEQSSVLVAEINHSPEEYSNIVVVLYQNKDGRITISNYSKLIEDNKGMFVIKEQRDYFLIVFDDKNENLFIDVEEPVAAYGTPTPINVSPDQQNTFRAIDMDEQVALSIRFSKDIAGSQAFKSKKVHQALIYGDIADLNKPMFSQEYGSKGFWTPYDFFNEVGMGVYFLEPYNPDKIPILFISGAGGFPGEWTAFFEGMDRNRFQPWFYHYPSGGRLERSARILSEITEELNEEYKFNTMYVTAHSMGGLVGRGFIYNTILNLQHKYIKAFITFSTPWSGHESANNGVRLSPAVIPSWHDMQTNSDYQRAIFNESLNEYINYYLFFSFNGTNNPFSEYNDGIVSVSSQLRWQAQKEATKTFGLNESHTDILKSKRTLETFNYILDMEYDKANK